MSLLLELKRRKVVRVLIAYAIAAWAIVQVAATAFPLLQLGDRYASYVLIVALAGFPIAAILAWMFDLTPRGVRRTKEGDTALEAAPWPLAYRIGAAILAIGLMAAGAIATIKQLDTESIRSIAVLPFRNLSRDTAQQYFSDGIAEELLNELAKIDGLSVVARTSSFSFRGGEEDFVEAQRKLKVHAFLTGSVGREGETVRVHARLVDANTGTQIWSDRFDRQLAGLFDVQAEITRAIVRALRMRVGDLALQTRGTRNPTAHDAYLLGLDHWHLRTAPDLQQAIDAFQRAIAADPNFAAAHAGLALSWAVLPLFATTTSAREAAAKGKAAAQRALELDPESAEGWAALSQIALNLEADAKTAAHAGMKAVELSPNYATAHQWYGEVLQVQRRLPEAREHIDRAIQLDPLSPAARNIKAFQLALEGRVDEAVTYLRETVRLYPQLASAHQILSIVLVGAGRYEQAKQEYAVIMPQLTAIQTVLDGAIALRDGRAGSAQHRAGIDAAKQLETMLPGTVASMFYATVGEDARAMELLHAAVRRRNDPSLAYFSNWAGFDRLRSTAEFQAILRDLGAL